MENLNQAGSSSGQGGRKRGKRGKRKHRATLPNHPLIGDPQIPIPLQRNQAGTSVGRNNTGEPQLTRGPSTFPSLGEGVLRRPALVTGPMLVTYNSKMDNKLGRLGRVIELKTQFDSPHVFLMDSNGFRLPRDYCPMVCAAFHSIAGAKASSYAKSLRHLATDEVGRRDLTFPTPTKVVFTIGINCRKDVIDSTMADYKEMLSWAGKIFPNARLYVTEINFHPSLPCQQKKTLETINQGLKLLLLRPDHPQQLPLDRIEVIPKLPASKFECMQEPPRRGKHRDHIHWTRETALELLLHWCEHLNLTRGTGWMANRSPCTVLNLSHRLLTFEEVQVLALGPKFIPLPQHLNSHRALLEAFPHFARRVLIRCFFANVIGEHGSGKLYDPRAMENCLKPKSSWIPTLQRINPLLLVVLDELFIKTSLLTMQADMMRKEPMENEMKQLLKRQPLSWDSLTGAERQLLEKALFPTDHLPLSGMMRQIHQVARKTRMQDSACNHNPLPDLSDTSVEVQQEMECFFQPYRRALKDLASYVFNERTLIIRPSDKGSTYCVMDRRDYVEEFHKQLSVQRHYTRLENQVSTGFHDNIREALRVLCRHDIIDKVQRDFCLPPKDFNPRKLYGLPKAHKLDWAQQGKPVPPLRPIVSNSGSDTSNIAILLDRIIAPLCCHHASYIRDTPHLLEVLARFKAPPDAILCTIDAEALYTNVNNEMALQAVKQEWFTRNLKDPNSDRDKDTWEAIHTLFVACMEFNDFKFADEWFLQIHGIAMGAHFSPGIANLFMSRFEESFFETLDPSIPRPLLFRRFLDDILVVYPNRPQGLTRLINLMNRHVKHIKFTYDQSSNAVHFLDLEIFKGPNFAKTGILDTKLYVKLTDTLQLLDARSWHPPHTFLGIVKSQLVRYQRNCTARSDEEEARSRLFASLSGRSYPRRMLSRAAREVDLKPRKRCRGGFKPCSQTSCKVCSKTFAQGTLSEVVKSVASATRPQQKQVLIIQTISCDTPHVVYVLACNNCGAQYVGQTIHCVRNKLSEHRTRFRQFYKRWGPSLLRAFGKFSNTEGSKQRQGDIPEIAVFIMQWISSGSSVSSTAGNPQTAREQGGSRSASAQPVAKTKQEDFRTNILYAHAVLCGSFDEYPAIPLKHFLAGRGRTKWDARKEERSRLRTETAMIEHLGTSYKLGGLNYRCPQADSRIPFVLRFTDQSKPVEDLTKDAFHELKRQCPSETWAAPMIAHKRNKNISEFICKADISTNPWQDRVPSDD